MFYSGECDFSELHTIQKLFLFSPLRKPKISKYSDPHNCHQYPPTTHTSLMCNKRNLQA